MLRSILMGLVAGQRAMTPLAALAAAARRGDLPEGAPARDLLAHPVVALGAAALAAAEMAGDKLPSAPDRIILPGLVGRSVTAAFAGAVLAPPERRAAAAAFAATAAVGASYIGFRLRVRAMRRFGQTSTGLVEDAIVLGSGLAIARRRG
ncbi:DUF4126 domain-containing protein [Rubellimicrobium rubrum]|uniref:DUF4126 domain-containing protein n=1 Tax=Rubellimicrobium rubrum TaxID=2585369 RepID=A0A5C4MPS5_9RHOB|nr:DUF4126 domain-containing protein [Rubellimicrobium rubrum]TNC45262.1 DUF4126 domain-containing protein [Rubellimicrobium rubrum]